MLVLIYLCSGITVIAPNQRGLILRFGHALPKSAPPGLLLAFPPPIDEVVMLPAKSVQEVVLDAWTPNDDSYRDSLHPARDPYTITGDVNIIRARFSIRFQLRIRSLTNSARASVKICATPFVIKAPVACLPA